ncbi:MAG: type II/IV secretion system protein, partial [Phascolarctobacterium sp.]|nr:type II/IV secretion system protein [Phascolarctobacterium sp.]
TGPTGSGKSTTLYATLQELNDETKNIITIEDPVERTIEGINQIAVNNKAGLTFATGLRSIVRQDPNIIMVGEIRDGETAKIAVQAALTGHLVFSTLHTNNAIGAVTRLLDIGIEPFLLAAALCGVVAQRLVRTICPYCEGGCDECNHTGYKGRIAVQEVLEITPRLQNMITHGAEESAILDTARENGFTTLMEDCLNKVQAGQTTLEEYYKVAFGVV